MLLSFIKGSPIVLIGYLLPWPLMGSLDVLYSCSLCVGVAYIIRYFDKKII